MADANRTRPIEVLEDLYGYCLTRAQAVAPKKSGFRFHGPVFALDSTTIELRLSLSPWAVFRRAKGAVKLHTAIDIAGNLPQFAVITDGKHHDLRTARENISVRSSQQQWALSAPLLQVSRRQDFFVVFRSAFHVEQYSVCKSERGCNESA